MKWKKRLDKARTQKAQTKIIKDQHHQTKTLTKNTALQRRFAETETSVSAISGITSRHYQQCTHHRHRVRNQFPVILPYNLACLVSF